MNKLRLLLISLLVYSCSTTTSTNKQIQNTTEILRFFNDKVWTVTLNELKYFWKGEYTEYPEFSGVMWQRIVVPPGMAVWRVGMGEEFYKNHSRKCNPIDHPPLKYIVLRREIKNKAIYQINLGYDIKSEDVKTGDCISRSDWSLIGAPPSIATHTTYVEKLDRILEKFFDIDKGFSKNNCFETKVRVKRRQMRNKVRCVLENSRGKPNFEIETEYFNDKTVRLKKFMMSNLVIHKDEEAEDMSFSQIYNSRLGKDDYAKKVLESLELLKQSD